LRPLPLILLAALALRSWHLFDPPWDYHNWRQTITLMVARDFARHGFPVLHPQVAWVSHNQPSAPSYFSGEFSLQSVLAAVLYRFLGESEVWARLVVIAFSLAGIYFLYHLLDRGAGPRAAWVGAFIYALLPYSVFFGRVFMPEIPAISLALGALCVTQVLKRGDRHLFRDHQCVNFRSPWWRKRLSVPSFQHRLEQRSCLH
jgi:4-amino-4-deoxy-L-arabinose transferase-like glycosyltransferase